MDRLTHAAIVVFSAVASLAPIVLAQTSSSSATSTSTSTSTTSSSSSVTACPTVLSPSYSAPVVGSGWTAQLVARNLTSPRSILFDSEGALLVVQQGVGILRVQFDDFGGTCLVVHSTTTVVENTDLNHAVQLSADGSTLYASTSNEAYRWPYFAANGSVGERQTLVTNMSNTDHVSRTLLLSRKASNTLVVSRGSSDNMDPVAQQLSSGHSQIRAFDIGNLPSGRPFDYASEGTRLGWGLRNSVGVAEHPITGGIFSVENSVDQIERDGTDIHQDNPGEEMNYHGFLNGSTESQGGNYGYPDCFALWGTGIPDQGGLTVGSQFVASPNSTLNDTTCAQDRVSPRLTFQAHMAPLDILFHPNGTVAYVTFHGSWDRTDPVGYQLSAVRFDPDAGQPVDPSDSTTATTQVLSNADNSQCPDGCFRPVGLAWDGQGRLFMSSDATGEIYVLQQDGAGEGTGATPGSSASGTLVTSTATAASSSTHNAAPRLGGNRSGMEMLWVVGLTVALSMAGGLFFNGL